MAVLVVLAAAVLAVQLVQSMVKTAQLIQAAAVVAQLTTRKFLPVLVTAVQA
jgi:hypothetical protein